MRKIPFFKAFFKIFCWNINGLLNMYLYEKVKLREKTVFFLKKGISQQLTKIRRFEWRC